MKNGYELQKVLLEKAKKKAFSKIWRSILNTTERAINFYIKDGFMKIRNHDFSVGPENFKFIAMSKPLELDIASNKTKNLLLKILKQKPSF